MMQDAFQQLAAEMVESDEIHVSEIDNKIPKLLS